MKPSHLLLVLLLALGAGYMGSTLHGGGAATAEAKKETAYERVMRTGVIRCGYVLYEPMVRKDPNTGELSGLTVDIMNEVGRLLSLKVEWTDEVGWATTVEGLKTGRYDAMCVGFWRIPNESKYVYHSMPFAYSPMVAVVRANDTRFDNNLEMINNPAIRIISSDGMEGSNVARTRFPKATLIELPNMTDIGTLYANVLGNKADVYFEDASTVQRFLDENPGQLKTLHVPLKVYQNTIAVPHDMPLKWMIDTAILQMLESGTMDNMLDKHDSKKTLLRVAKGYAAP